MKPQNIAHRCGAGLRAENSLSAIEHAIALGCDGAEIDVQLTRDGRLAVFHDFSLNPEFCRDGKGRRIGGRLIRDMSADELADIAIGRPLRGSDYAKAHPELVPCEDMRIPFLEDVIARTRRAPDFRLFVEIKSSLEDTPLSAPGEQIALETVALLRRKNFLSRVTLVGFDWRALIAAKRAAPALEIWFSTGENVHMPPKTLAAVIAAQEGQGWFAHHTRIDAEGAALMRSAGLKLGAWTVNDRAEMQRLGALGIDAICTDYPDRLSTI